MPDLHSNCLTFVVFLKEFYKKVDFEKISAGDKKAWKLPSRHRVKHIIVMVKPIILQIYLTAGNVYSLETKVQSLADKVKAVNALAEQDKMERLEDQVARTVAKVAHAEREVCKFV